MRQQDAKGGTRERAAAYMIDGKYLKARRRRVACVLLLMWLGGQVGFWAWYLSLSVKPTPWTSAFLLDVACSLVVCMALLGAFAMSKGMCVLLTETRMIVNMYGMGGTKAIAMSRDMPIVIKKDASGRHWELASSSTGSKPIKLPYMAFPELGRWAMEVAHDMAKVELIDPR